MNERRQGNEEILSLLGRMDQKLDDIKEDVTRHDHLLNGNGQEGLITKFTKLQAQFKIVWVGLSGMACAIIYKYFGI